ncbi:short chain dehydrogenase [Kockovaella imperatae]|uniref:Short chain dehydrogenase n=1 Tax=Kockovaella imperatae TaxID=4999 RepID=A0A1Y1UKT0_9TREE|nr:short chain dehydrogenase [Kockovaella imperatae]ORX38660.1 short chain dehydrogenase [Kockovaella imperatae]
MLSIAVVTGAAGGLGRAISLELSKKYHVALLDLEQSRLDIVAEEIGKDKTSTWICDITCPEQVERVSKEIIELGRVKCLVNNAGHADKDTLHETTPSSWRSEVALNLDASFTVFHSFESSFRDHPTDVNIINIASVNGVMSCVGNPAYSAAKAGLISLTKSMAIELGGLGIRANAILPGTVITGAWTERLKVNPKAMDDIIKWYPLKRRIVPEDIAKAVAFLDTSPAITGICLPVDAGLTAGSTPIAAAITHSPLFDA